MSDTNEFVNHYAELGVSQTATGTKIDEAYAICLVQATINNNWMLVEVIDAVSAQERERLRADRLTRIHQAHRVLMNRESRAQFDRELGAHEAEKRSAEPMSTITSTRNLTEQPTYGLNRTFWALLVLAIASIWGIMTFLHTFLYR